MEGPGPASAAFSLRTLLLFVVLLCLLLTALGIRFGLGQASQFQEQRLRMILKLIGRACHP